MSAEPNAPRPEALPPGRELDALIAEHVFGWQVEAWESINERTVTVYVPGYERPAQFGWSKTSESSWQSGDASLDFPAYSTDIAAAFSVIDALGGIVEIRRAKPDEWHVALRSPTEWYYTRWAETLPLAICRLALHVAAFPSDRAALAAVERAP